MPPWATYAKPWAKFAELKRSNVANQSQDHLQMCKVALIDTPLEDAMALHCRNNIFHPVAVPLVQVVEEKLLWVNPICHYQSLIQFTVCTFIRYRLCDYFRTVIEFI